MAIHRWFCFRYPTIREVQVHDIALARIFWIGIFVGFLGIINYMCFAGHYQTSESAITHSTVKIRGSARPANYEEYYKNKSINGQPFMFDQYDLVTRRGLHTIIVTTSFEHFSDTQIVPADFNYIGSRVPVEALHQINMDDLAKWTVHWNQYLYFPKFQFSINSHHKGHGNKDAMCSVRRICTLRDIVDAIHGIQTDPDNPSYNSLSQFAERGASITVLCDWRCDLDFKKCTVECNVGTSQLHGFHQDSTAYDQHSCKSCGPQTLIKFYGLRIKFVSNGKALKASLFKVMEILGASMSFVAFLRVGCDLLLMFCVRHKARFYNEKYQHIYWNGDENKFMLTASLCEPRTYCEFRKPRVCEQNEFTDADEIDRQYNEWDSLLDRD